MQDLKFVTIEDIKDFLRTLNYNWNEEIKVCGKAQPVHIENFRYSTCLIVKDLTTNKKKDLHICVSDDYFHIVKDNPKIKYDVIDHSLMWQAFMLERKSKNYARFLYQKTIIDQKNLIDKFDTKLGLVQQQTEQLKFEKALKTAALNTTLYNVEQKLSAFERKRLNIKINKESVDIY